MKGKTKGLFFDNSYHVGLEIPIVKTVFVLFQVRNKIIMKSIMLHTWRSYEQLPPIIQDGKLVGAVTHVCVFG